MQTAEMREGRRGLGRVGECHRPTKVDKTAKQAQVQRKDIRSIGLRAIHSSSSSIMARIKQF